MWNENEQINLDATAGVLVDGKRAKTFEKCKRTTMVVKVKNEHESKKICNRFNSSSQQ